jgi:hypothetical protein
MTKIILLMHLTFALLFKKTSGSKIKAVRASNGSKGFSGVKKPNAIPMPPKKKVKTPKHIIKSPNR